MIGYVTIGVSDMEKAKKYYTDLLGDMGAKVLMDLGRIAFIGKDMKSPMMAVCTPYDGSPNHPGSGNMLAFQPGSKEAVDTCYHKAIELGASCGGEPGQRIPGRFYGADVKDPDGNKVAFYHFG